MHRRHLLLVPPLFALLLPTSRTASATPPDTQNAEASAATLVEKKLVQPLAEKEARRSRFSRAYIPPQARRVRVLDRELSTDGRGAAFVAFAVDERSGVLEPLADDLGRWRKDAIVGCVYPARDEIFIRRGDKFFGVGLLLGQKTAAAADTACRPAPTGVHSNPPALTSRSG